MSETAVPRFPSYSCSEHFPKLLLLLLLLLLTSIRVPFINTMVLLPINLENINRQLKLYTEYT